MLRRLLLALLTLCLALPAAAMPLSTAPTSMAGSMHHEAAPSCHEQQAPTDHGKQQQRPPAAHDCIGCIAPLCRLPAMPAAPSRLTTAHVLVLAKALSGSALRPDTPPPRT
ncbi:hypothetical protein [Novosphingobium sp.]|uniref:hypothetical protein n=1 Tax=Novosphingobium sp. TaxID=1874826 RepID=UPI0035AE23BE